MVTAVWTLLAVASTLADIRRKFNDSFFFLLVDMVEVEEVVEVVVDVVDVDVVEVVVVVPSQPPT